MTAVGRSTFQLHFAQVTPSTCWVFVRLESADGFIGWGEASLAGSELRLRELAPPFAAAVCALPSLAPWGGAVLGPPKDLPSAALTSAIDMALWDIEGRRQAVPVAELLVQGPPARGAVTLYANVNRRTRDRSPAGFADSARAAVGQGFDAVKIAPFDEAGRGRTQAVDLAPGIERARAVRDAVGPGVRLMIDCHWRLDEAAAETVVDAAAELGVYWVECPLPETEETLDALVRLRGSANARGMRLAGCELGIGRDGFSPFLRRGAYDVMMPDAKYVGGLREMAALAPWFDQAGVEFSPHNPSGPICHAASLQVCAAVARAPCLEVQFDETPAFEHLQQRPMTISNGQAGLPSEPGLGSALRSDVLESLAAPALSIA